MIKKKILAGIFIASMFVRCAGTPKEIQEYKPDIHTPDIPKPTLLDRENPPRINTLDGLILSDKSIILKNKFFPNSEETVIYVKNYHFHEIHNQYDEEIVNFQKNLFDVLDEIIANNKIGLLGFEYFGEMTEETLSKKFELKDLIEKMPDNNGRRKYVRDEIIGSQKFIDNKLSADSLQELIYGDSLVIFGSDDINAYLMCQRAYNKLKLGITVFSGFENGEAVKKIKEIKKNWESATDEEKKFYKDIGGMFQGMNEEFISLCCDERSYKAVPILVEEMKRQKEHVSILVFGGLHTDTIVEKLEEMKTSYMVIEPKGYIIRNTETEFDSLF